MDWVYNIILAVAIVVVLFVVGGSVGKKLGKKHGYNKAAFVCLVGTVIGLFLPITNHPDYAFNYYGGLGLSMSGGSGTGTVSNFAMLGMLLPVAAILCFLHSMLKNKKGVMFLGFVSEMAVAAFSFSMDAAIVYGSENSYISSGPSLGSMLFVILGSVAFIGIFGKGGLKMLDQVPGVAQVKAQVEEKVDEVKGHVAGVVGQDVSAAIGGKFGQVAGAVVEKGAEKLLDKAQDYIVDQAAGSSGGGGGEPAQPDPAEQMKKLQDLYSSGVISKEEFEEKREKWLALL
ncbi:MAG: SHOCT domain-containing protein [Promethearchaeota archaeon]